MYRLVFFPPPEVEREGEREREAKIAKKGLRFGGLLRTCVSRDASIPALVFSRNPFPSLVVGVVWVRVWVSGPAS